MRIIGLVFALLVTLSMAALALTYTGQDRIYLQGHPGSHPGPSSTRTAAGDADPSLQRYYSESEGWTYYTLPSYSSAPPSESESR